MGYPVLFAIRIQADHRHSSPGVAAAIDVFAVHVQHTIRGADGPVTWSLYVDTYFAWDFHMPADHTIFPTTTGPRHNEISLNLAHLGIDLTGLDGPIGRLYIQYGSTVETIAGQDTTTTRGFFLTNRLLQYVQQAAVGLIPELARARMLEAWAGLRPGTPDDLPILGATPTPGYYVAAGHFRDGILLAPVTAHVMAQVVCGSKPDYEIAPFSFARFAIQAA